MGPIRMTIWMLPMLDPVRGAYEVPRLRRCEGDRGPFLLPLNDTDSLLADALCSRCGGCGRDRHDTCRPAEHADWDTDDDDQDDDEVCLSCHGRGWWVCDAFAGDDVYRLRAACGCSHGQLVTVAGVPQ